MRPDRIRKCCVWKVPGEYNINRVDNYTDLQRENMQRKIIGTIVQWDLPVYEVSSPQNGVYQITTQADFGRNLMAADVYITARDDKDREMLLSLKANDVVSFKDKVSV